jgi:phage/plasmid primase-like uncharacterized protein
MTAPGLIARARAAPIGEIAAGLQLRRVGAEFVGPCPVCGGTDRFSIHPGRGLFHCRGCGAGGDVIALAQHIYGVGFAAAIEMLAGARPPQDSQRPQHQAPAREGSDTRRLAYADRIWRAAASIAGTPGEAYLRDRGIALEEAPDHAGLCFLPACPYGPHRLLPCILARYTDILTGAERGIHRRSIITGTTPKTMSLGPIGSAVVRLWPDEDVTQGLVIGEGVETVLAAATRIEHRGTLLCPAWACGSAGTLEAFPVLPGIEALTILADHDASGRGQEAAERCAERWADAGREVTILTPRDLGDMNDIIRRAPA